MSFASDARGELARDLCTHICCARSELSAALLSSGGISYRGKDRYALSLTAIDAAVVRRYFGLLKQFWGVTCCKKKEEQQLSMKYVKKVNRYSI